MATAPRLVRGGGVDLDPRCAWALPAADAEASEHCPSWSWCSCRRFH